MNTEQKEEDDGEADDGEANDDDHAAAVIGIGSLGQLALFWPSWCSFLNGVPLWTLLLRIYSYIDCKDGSEGGCSAGVFSCSAVVDDGTAVLSINPDGVVGDLAVGGC